MDSRRLRCHGSLPFDQGFKSTKLRNGWDEAVLRRVAMTTLVADPLPRAGSRIVLRRLRQADLADFQAYRTDPEVGRYQGWSPVPSNVAQVFLSDMSRVKFSAIDVWFQVGIADRATDRLIGDIGFSICGPDHDHAELGFSLARPAQGQGLATEAVRAMMDLLFEVTGVARIVSITHAQNLACIRLLQRVGMRQVGTVDTVFRGENCAEHVFAIWRDRPTAPPDSFSRW